MGSPKRSARAWLAVGAIALAAGGVVACGDEEEPSTGGGGAAAEEQAASDPVVEEAKSRVAALDKAPTDIGVSEPLEGSVEGKKLIFVSCLAPICNLIGSHVKEAAAVLGMQTQVIQAGATPDTITKAYNSAVAAKPDGVVASSIPPTLWQPQLKALKDAGIPVITNAAAAPEHDGVVAQFYDDKVTAEVGVDVASWVLADSNGSAKTVNVFTPEFAGLVPQADAYRDTIQKCEKCSWERLDVKSSDVGKVIPGRVVSYLQRNPDVKYVSFQYGDLATGVPQALKGAGIEGVKLVSSGGGPVNYQYIQNGEQARDLSLYLDVYGWQIADAMARALLDKEVTVPDLPDGWISEANSDFDAKKQPPFGAADWQDQFKKLWGVE